MIKKITTLVPSINLPSLPILNNIDLSQSIPVYMVDTVYANTILNSPEFSIEYLSSIDAIDLISKVETWEYYVPVSIPQLYSSYSLSSISNIDILANESLIKHNDIVARFSQIESNNSIIENYLDILSDLDPTLLITQLPHYTSLINVLIQDNNSLLNDVTIDMDIFIQDPFSVLSKKLKSVNDFATIDPDFVNTSINASIATINNFFT